MKRSALDQFVEKLLTNPRQGERWTARCDPSPPDVVARLLSMPLDRFEQEGELLEIEVKWQPENLWFAPNEAAAAALIQAGVSRGLIWTARELTGLLAIPGVTREQVKKVAMAKAIFMASICTLSLTVRKAANRGDLHPTQTQVSPRATGDSEATAWMMNRFG